MKIKQINKLNKSKICSLGFLFKSIKVLINDNIYENDEYCAFETTYTFLIYEITIFLLEINAQKLMQNSS